MPTAYRIPLPKVRFLVERGRVYLPRSLIPRGGLLLGQLLTGRPDEAFPYPVRQAHSCPFCRLTDQGVMLGQESDSEGGRVRTRLFLLWSSHALECRPIGPTGQEEKTPQPLLTRVPIGPTITPESRHGSHRPHLRPCLPHLRRPDHWMGEGPRGQPAPEVQDVRRHL